VVNLVGGGLVGEPAALYCWIFLLIAILGPGAFALDMMFRRPGPGRAP
jgi:putative oxidoreductase